MEEDIEIVESFLEDFRDEKGEFENWHRYTTIRELQAIENLVSRLKKVDKSK